jgi:hypothetical protein
LDRASGVIIDSIMGWIYGAEFDVRSYVKDFHALATGKHKKPRAEYAGKSSLGIEVKKFAVVAIHPGSKAADFSLVHLLKSLHDTGFWVLVVSTLKLSDDQREKFGTYCNHVIERHGIGRDFGSYQMGLRWLEKNGYLQDAERLILANDSLFYPSSFGNQIQQLLDEDRPWSALFENFEWHYHSQSFFQMFKRDIFNAEAFKRFWRDYWPFSTRGHGINKGEVGLSEILINSGIPQYTLFRSDAIGRDVVAKLQSALDEKLVLAIKHTLNLTGVARRNYGDIILKRQRQIEWDIEVTMEKSRHELAQSIVAEAEFSNPTQRLGLICSILYEAPIKRDIAYRGSIEIGTLVMNCCGFSEEEKRLIREDLVLKGLPQSLISNKRLLSLYRDSRI